MRLLARSLFIVFGLITACTAMTPSTPDAGATAGGGTGGSGGGSAGGVLGGGGGSGGGTLGGGGGGECFTSGAGGAINIGSWNTFVSSVKTTGELGGIQGADAYCSRLASAAGRPGAKAYVTVGSEQPLQQWIRRMAAQPGGLWWYGPLLSNEHGVPMKDVTLWTGHRSACVADENCRGWLSSDGGDFGIAVAQPTFGGVFGLPVDTWTNPIQSPCSAHHSLLCVYFDYGRADGFSTVPPPPLPAPKRHLFVTREQFSGALGGLAAANQRCIDLASDAGFSGSWRAFLSTSGLAFSIGGDGGWARRLDDDGGSMFQTPLNLGTTPRRAFGVDQYGAALDGGRLWTGTKLWLTPSADDCAGWTSVDAGGTAGTIDRLDETWSDDGVVRCDTPAHLLCLQE
ncbi:MAG: DUF1554 domain-containing protein [Myxococcaceae bacterium]|jgi:hypothetical protein|nr:DUF1554 domain-containing protein [Myxococcaceae bacterium]